MRITSSVVQGILVSYLQAHLAAQVSNRTGALTGVVVDPQGAPVGAAAVVAKVAATNQQRETRTNERGEYLLANLPAGEYSVEFRAAGFAERSYGELLVGAGQTLTLKVEMRVAAVAEKMEVTEEAPVLDTSSPNAAVTFGYERMEHSSAQGRNYVNFVLTAPGMAPAAGQSTGRSPAAMWNANNDSGFVSNGMRSRNNSVSIDGTDNRDETTGAIRVSVPLEMVQELRIAGTTVSAELGGAAGGVVNVVTRSGSNQVHGHGEFLFQNEALNARNPEFGIAGRPRLRRWQPGASASGPVKRDQTFFAAAMEIYREDCDEWSESFARLREGYAFRAGERDYQYSGKVQHLFNAVHSGTLRYAYSLGRVRDGVQGIENHSDYSARGSSRIADHAVVGTLTSALSSALIHNLTFQYGRRGAALSPNSRDPFVEIPGVMSFGQNWRLDQARTETHTEFVDGLTWIAGRHTVSFGGSLHHVRFDGRLANRFGGITVFPTLAAFEAGAYDFRVRAMGEPATQYSTTPVGLWVNDRWRVRRGLSVEAGLRYDYQFLPGGIPTAKTNVAPRMGLAWNPGGDSKTVFRLGAGLFFDRYPLAFLNEALQKDGVRAWEEFEYPGLRFRAAYRPAQQLRATYGVKLTGGLERQLNADTTLALEYSHTRGLHLPRLRNWRGGLPAEFLLENNARSRYDGVTVTLSRKMTSEFGYLLSYTGGRTLDDGSDFDEQPQNPLDLRAEWARSRQHQAHRITATALFEIEALEKLSEKLEHIHFVPTFTYGSGRPLPALETSDRFRTAAYPLTARAAGLGRNPFLTPANASLDARVFKEIRWDERKTRLQVGVEGYNLLNRANPIRLLGFYSAGGTRLANHGEAIEFSAARQLQLFLHFEF